MKYNILFLLKSFEIGGLEVVTAVLANKFASEGHNVALWAFYEGKTTLADRLDSRVPITYGYGFNSSRENIESLKNIITKRNIQIVINQWGLPYVPAMTLKKAARNLGVKSIAVYHNDPATNGRLKEVEIALERCDNPIKRVSLKLKFNIIKAITSASMRYIYNCSDRFMVLSDSFVAHFKNFTGIGDPKKLVVQTNPVTIEDVNSTTGYTDKLKEVIYMGRLDYNQKRVHRIIETWALIENSFPDWRLTIVGDGTERKNMERLAHDLNLCRISFEGFQRPEPYYERASVLVLASEYEGFPLVLAECMSFGVVPVVYGSYSAVYDIIKSGVNGMVVAPQDNGFHAEAMAKALTLVMSDDEKRSRMAQQAVVTSREYSVDTIYRQWTKVFNDILNE